MGMFRPHPHKVRVGSPTIYKQQALTTERKKIMYSLTKSDAVGWSTVSFTAYKSLLRSIRKSRILSRGTIVFKYFKILRN